MARSDRLLPCLLLGIGTPLAPSNRLYAHFVKSRGRDPCATAFWVAAVMLWNTMRPDFLYGTYPVHEGSCYIRRLR